MPDTARYAIYYMPATTTALWTFGCRVLGYDPAHPGATPPQPYDALAAAAPASAVQEPSIYGFHATLKAPFELSAASTENALLQSAQAFARRERSFSIGPLRVTRLHTFIALCPAERHEPLHQFADRCVVSFEPFRARLSAHDRARRLAAPLTSEHIANLERWGYPYVFAQFQFHMTLSGSLGPDAIAPLHRALAELYAPIDTDLQIDGLAVFKQERRGERFRVLQRFAFG